MPSKTYPWDIPDVILLLGTDASGKDHVANVLMKMIHDSGGEVEKRQRFFSGTPTRAVSSEGKGAFETLQEKLFLRFFKHLGPILPMLVSLVTLWDLRRFRLPKEKKLVVIGHNCMRALGFYLAHNFKSPEQIRLPWYLVRVIETLLSKTEVHVIALDVEDHVRKQRIAKRISEGAEDEFDKYMHKDGDRSEHIEACLVYLSLKYLEGQLIENNDLTEEELRDLLKTGFSKNSV